MTSERKRDTSSGASSSVRKSGGKKFADRPYKPRKPKARKPRSAEAILKEARETRKKLISKGKSLTKKRPSLFTSTVAYSHAEPAHHTPLAHLKKTNACVSTASHVFEPIVEVIGNGPVIASGHGQFDCRPEVWAADDFYVILEANPEPSSKLPVHLIGFRYLMSASCFYRESRNPHRHPHPRPIMIYTLEHSAVLAHDRPGFFGQLLGEKAKPINMIVGLFLNNLRTQLPGVSYDEDFTRGRQRLLALVRERLGISAYFDHAGHFNRGQLLPAMR